MADENALSVESRVQTVEQRLNGVEHSVESLSRDVRALAGGFTEFQGEFKAFIVEQKATKPAPIKDLLYLAIAIGTIISMVITALWFFVDVRVGFATVRTNSFVEEMTHNGKIFVDIHDLNTRLSRIESHVHWKVDVEK
jgi:hypothetical protein